MHNFKHKKNKRILFLFLITITISLFNFSNLIWNFNDDLPDSNLPIEIEFFGGLKTSDYSINSNGTGGNFNISLHQSLVNTTETEFSNIDNYNTLVEACPKSDPNFNSSYIEIDVDHIIAPNKTIDIESSSSNSILDITSSIAGAAHFISRGNGYIENVSVRLTNIDLTNNATCQLVLYAYDAGNNRPAGTNQFDEYAILGNFQFPNNTYSQWYTLTGIHQKINNSDTDDNKWFIGLLDNSVGGGDMWWDYTRDDLNFGGDGLDETDSYLYTGGAWTLYQTIAPATYVDFNVMVDLAPLNNTPTPTQINLTINNKVVSDIDYQSGTWIDTTPQVNPSGNIDFTISADWWDVSCNITSAQLNYTKTDLKASSEFNIAGSGQIVEWNITRNGGLNYFDTRLDNYQINFTIPNTWDENTLNVFNGATPKTLDSTNRSLGNGYREVNVLNAGNGTYWYLIADSANLLSSIDSLNTFDFSDIAHFEATFSEGIKDSDGIINLSVYSPAIWNNELNYSVKVESFTAGSVISLTDWDISDNVIKYGDFRVHVYWNNDTAAGFREKLIRIFGETSLIPSLPDTTFNASDTFVIDLFFNDTGLDAGIPGAIITHRLDGGAIKSAASDLGNGNYQIIVDCNDPDFSAYGPNLIEIIANKTYYNNQSETEQIIILGETDLDSSILKNFFDSTETFNVSLYLNDTVKGSGIFGAIRNVFVDSIPFTPISDFDYGDGNYNITINCDDDYFDSNNYGSFNLSIEIEKPYYHNHTTSFPINITGVTDLSTTKFPDPTIGYYNSDELFNITAYFEDVGRSEGIDGGTAKIYVKEVSASSYQEYTPVIINPIGGGYYNITVDCSDPMFNPYGKYNIKINVTKADYYTAEDILLEVVVGNTTLTINDPTGTISYVENEVFDIVIEYLDHTLAIGIIGANITYSLDGTNYRTDNISDNLDGTYNITIDAADAQFGSNYGNVDIIIRANRTNYINLTRTLTFERQIITHIAPSNTPSQFQEIRGNIIFYTFNYSDNSNNPIESYDLFQNTTSLQNFEWNLVNDGAGNYTLELNTSKVVVTGMPYTLNFSISAFGNQSQEISIQALITVIETRIENIVWNENADFARSTRINISIDFYFNDTTNIMPITGLSSGDISVRDNDTGVIWSPGFELFDLPGPGNYRLNISTTNVISGTYTLELGASKFPNYNWDYVYLQFYLRGNYTQVGLISVADTGGILAREGLYNNYTIFQGSNIDIEFNLTDLEYSNAMILGDADSYSVFYRNLNTNDSGILLDTLGFIYQNVSFGTHLGVISASNVALVPGNYLINISFTKGNYESSFLPLNLTIIEKFQVRLNFTYVKVVNAGASFTFLVKAEFLNGSVWYPLSGSDVIFTPYFNDNPDTIQTLATNSTGEVSFSTNVLGEAITMNITIQLVEEYDHLGELSAVSDIEVIPLQGFDWKDLLPYLLVIGIAIGISVGSIAVYRGVVVPKKHEKSRILKEVKTIFDDAINLEHVLVLYKATGTCIFFKSFGSEEIDPELISGFISAISSFGKDLVCQEELNEITYGDKMLLLSDGEHIRVALVLGKKASIILRKSLMEFIITFEKDYSNDLPAWRGQLNIFRESGSLVDDILNTSIILPHEITYEFSNVKSLRNPHSKEVLKVANNLMKDSERNFFFIATLLKESTDKTSKDTAEIFMGIKELRDKKMLVPIEISTIEGHTISQQELSLLNQKVAGLTNLTQEEKQKLVSDLSQIGPAEREAYFASLSEQHEIISAPIEERSGVAIIDTVKAAKKEIKNLIKGAKSVKKEKDFARTINIFQNAAKIATNWELSGELDQLNEFIRTTKIEDLTIKMKVLEKEAKQAAKGKKYNEAAQKYKMSSKIASEIFKLGGTDLTKEVKRLSNKSKEYEKLI
ncbi:MAG: hypothetical protein ACXADU_06075 [Promethearchaeota archaeon]|jgi:hypothetical protein